MIRSKANRCLSALGAALVLAGLTTPVAAQDAGPGSSLIEQPYVLDTGVESRSISFENITGAKGEGAKAASPLGEGRKGAPARLFKPGETVDLADIEGPGVIRHIWMTMPQFPQVLRGLTLRGYWDGQDHPSIEAPVGDFFGFAHGTSPAFQSAVHSVGERLGMNMWLPMPFKKGAHFTLTNELPVPIMVYFQMDYTIGDTLPEDVGRLHVLFRRQNPTVELQDFEIMPYRQGTGRYIGTVIGIRPLQPVTELNWWGEGEVKMFLDGDKEFPTYAGTGAEDYVGVSYGLQQTPFLYNGVSWVGKDKQGKDYASMYRWHLPDPVYFKKDIRITIQQMGCCKSPPPPMPGLLEGDTVWRWYMDALYERSDDYSASTFWYEAVPSAALPEYPDLGARLANLPDMPRPGEAASEDAKEGE